MIISPKILPEPKLPDHISSNAKWLAGEGAGSWFLVEIEKEGHFKIKRYSPVGKLECEGDFFSISGKLDLKKEFNISYPSHCATVTLVQEKEVISLKRL